MKKNTKIAAISAAAVIGITGIAAGGQVFANTGAGEAGLPQAEEAALAEVAGEVISSDFEQEDGTTEYEFEIRTEDGAVREVEVRDGTVISDEEDDEGEEQEESADFEGAAISKDEAQQLALDAVPGTVTETEADGENGTPVYEFEIAAEDGNEFSVEVNAETGDVKTENEDD
ncbi:PepSY domain-containing protein [Indiicoccus explosivorum]|uniref:PepSY domain-containing protein n=1 Tax=Indiicoccus explosivorum TaxID=1917864 RepID=UPI000B434FD2|nr:PepSY domain-containing protein [Indiicoccus explosivorum]